MSATTVGQALDRNSGIGPGFDFLRIWLAASVIWFHSFVVCGTMDQLESGPGWFYVYTIMPMFFALSGFLIAGSAQRLNLKNFLVNRGLRIVPALAVEITLSALVLGPLFTKFSLVNYFTNDKFFHYFTNIFGWIQYELPGVFLENASKGVVNQSLWTIPFEIGCYVLMSIVIVFRFAHKPLLLAFFASALLVLPALAQTLGFLDIKGKTAFAPLNYLLFSRGALLFPAFLFGAVGYWFRDSIRLLPGVAIICVALCLAVAIFNSKRLAADYSLNLVFVPVLVYLTMYIGTRTIPPIPFYSSGDYSYGVYLYGYPIQQSLVILLPGIRHWLPQFALAIIFSTAMAALSWHLIEKPILRLRKKFSFVARIRGVEGAGVASAEALSMAPDRFDPAEFAAQISKSAA